MKVNFRILNLFIAACLWTACSEEGGNRKQLSETDRNFIIKASQLNFAEIELGQLAASKGNTVEVRLFGGLVLDAHTTAHLNLKDLADQQDYDVDLPDAPDAAHRQLKQLLQSLSGETFDTAFMKSQITDHQIAIALFSDELANGQDGELVNYARLHLPFLRRHLQKADSIVDVITSK